MTARTATVSGDEVLPGVGRATEDYLDWLENQERQSGTRRRWSNALIGVAVTLTAASVAVIAFVGF